MKIVPIALAGLVLAAAPLRADEVTETMERARDAYAQRNLAVVAEELGFALAAVARLRYQEYVVLFPKAPSGWVLEDPRDDGTQSAMSAQAMGVGLIVDREYTQQNGEGRIRARLSVDSPLVQAMGAMVSNPTMLQAYTRRIRIGRDNAMVKQEPGSQQIELTLVRGNTLVQLESEGVAQPDLLIELAKGFDLSKTQRR
ncbi:hypothetical protein IAI18_05675 [Acetobacteraceae bacterium H6797]|nr:hypothetical protein [Acetobacteraceae bacterium H6797]